MTLTLGTEVPELQVIVQHDADQQLALEVDTIAGADADLTGAVASLIVGHTDDITLVAVTEPGRFLWTVTRAVSVTLGGELPARLVVDSGGNRVVWARGTLTVRR